MINKYTGIFTRTFFLFLLLMGENTHAISMSDTINVLYGDTIILEVSNTEENIQWEKSVDGAAFMPISNAIDSSYQFVMNESEAMFRAKLVLDENDKDCQWYSTVYVFYAHSQLPHIIGTLPIDTLIFDYSNDKATVISQMPQQGFVIDEDSLYHKVDLTWTLNNYDPVNSKIYPITAHFQLPSGLALPDTGLLRQQKINTVLVIKPPTAPQIATRVADEVTSNAAVLFMDIFNNGGMEITEKGFYWDTLPTPISTGEKIVLSGGSSYLLDNLRASSQYYFAAYALNSVDTSYGYVYDFKTKFELTGDSVYYSYYNNPGNWDSVYVYSYDEDLTPIEKRLIYNGAKIFTDTQIQGDSAWISVPVSSNVKYLVFSNTDASIQSPMVEVEEPVYYNGENIYFSAPELPNINNVRDVDGNKYNTVIIGNQLWMKENLRVTHYQDGSPIEYGGDNPLVWANNVDGVFAWNNELDPSMKEQYGALYNWYAVSNSKKICPTGWAVASNEDWQELFDYSAIMNKGVDSYFKESQFQDQFLVEASNDYGIDIYSAGRVNPSGLHYGGLANHWTSNQANEQYAYSVILKWFNSAIINGSWPKNYGYSVRCIKKDETRDLPFVLTINADKVKAESAKLYGAINYSGKSEITKYGIYFGMENNPENTGSEIFSSSASIDNFSVELTQLKPSTTYYYRAFATNRAGQVTGHQFSFKTKNTIDSIVAPNIDATFQWYCNATVEQVKEQLLDSITVIDSDSNFYRLAIKWDILESDPLDCKEYIALGHYSLPDSVFLKTVSALKNPFVKKIDLTPNPVPNIVGVQEIDTLFFEFDGKRQDLIASLPDSLIIIDSDSTTYKVTAVWDTVQLADNIVSNFVLNSEIVLPDGVYQNWLNPIYNFQLHVVVLDTVCDYEGNVYSIVKCGNQIWMAENLRSLKYADGSEVSGYITEESDTNFVKNYGYLYQWDAAMKDGSSSSENPSGIQGICPTGWHLPSKAEWIELQDTLGGSNIAGGKLKSMRTAPEPYPSWKADNEGATNQVGFDALPAGYGSNYDQILDTGESGYWWSATEVKVNLYSTRPGLGKLVYNSSVLSISPENVDYASVRCVKDK